MKLRFLPTSLVTVVAIAFAANSIPLTLKSVQAQSPSGSESEAFSQQGAPGEQRVLYVNPNPAKAIANGVKTQVTPLTTITAALQQATPGTVIELAPGQYSNESFPLTLKPGVSLRGNESQQGQGVTIVGGGNYNSQTFARQNVTIVAADNSEIVGITISNPNTRGTGIWVESTQPVIRNNTFTNNHREGVFVTGTGAPRIENNRFINNGGNGISLARRATGQIQGNLFENTGFGIAVGGSSAPVITNNQIRSNRAGIIATQDSRPSISGNTIENNQQYGLIAIANAQPSLGQNTMRANGQGDSMLANAPQTVQASNPSNSQPTNSSAISSSNNSKAMFSCVESGAGYATVTQRGNATIPQPMITWTRTDLGPELTPERRCQIVTQRINEVVDRNGGTLDNLVFTVGPVQRQLVVCLVDNMSSSCSSNNMLFTLSRENARNPEEVVRRLVTFSVTGSGRAVGESSGRRVPQVRAPLSEFAQRLQPEESLWFVDN